MENVYVRTAADLEKKYKFTALSFTPEESSDWFGRFEIIVPVKEGESIDRALKRYKRKYEKTGVVKELRERQKFTKPSVLKRAAHMKAVYVQKLRDAEENM